MSLQTSVEGWSKQFRDPRDKHLKIRHPQMSNSAISGQTHVTTFFQLHLDG